MYLYGVVQKEFRIAKDRDDEIPFIIYSDVALTTRRNITTDDIYFVARTKWDRATVVFALDSLTGGISKTVPVNGECKLVITPTESNQEPGAYYGELLIITATGEEYSAWLDGFAISIEVAG